MARQNVYAYRINSNEQITSSGTSVASGPTPFGCNVARIACHGASGAPLTFFEVGTNPTALTDGTSTFIHDGDENYITVRPSTTPGGTDGDKIAVIVTSGSANVFISWLEG
jgi:hypothetical protein